MRNNISHISLIAAAGACTLLAAPALAGEASERGEAELAELLEGRVAGEPVRCLHSSQRDSLTVIDDTAFVFRDGDTLYVNRPSGARFLSWSDIPVFKPFGSQYCALDHVEMRDRSSLINGPVLTLSEFVPYRRVEDARTSEGG